ncbi:MAG: hypothetical protein JSS47_18980 [Proteobacteria bacterium]|nr:hypothetical protein [Pseudomonadota bacterium]
MADEHPPSGNLDEYRIAALLAAGAPIDGFGVGTQLTTSADAPALDSAYKLQAYAGQARRKRSEGKATWPGAKQVWRSVDGEGRLAGDVVSLADEPSPDGNWEPLLQPVMRRGRRLVPPEPLAALRTHAASELARLPAALRDLGPAAAERPYPVAISASLQALAREIDARPH